MQRKSTIAHKKNRSKKHKDGDETPKDPLNELGFGVCAYRDILWSFFWGFVVFSILLIPQMNMFNQGTAYQYIESSLVQNAGGMLGNLGYSTVNCANMPVQVGSMVVSCAYGQIGAFTQIGVSNPFQDGNAPDICIVNSNNLACKPDSTMIQSAASKAVGQ